MSNEIEALEYTIPSLDNPSNVLSEPEEIDIEKMKEGFLEVFGMEELPLENLAKTMESGVFDTDPPTPLYMPEPKLEFSSKVEHRPAFEPNPLHKDWVAAVNSAC